ncbi:hypothetical protein BJX66DRAFT_349675 [Aspergillus keveii]|uniref:FAD-binding domain-containing protein n=1 Tax=Aspergillus keveii TaxID=714993 RepID=A0ABR4FJ41_9EURO
MIYMRPECELLKDPPPQLLHTEQTPIIIVGAGPVGLLLALLLARKKIRSVVLEKNDSLDTSPRGVVHYPPVLEVFKDAGIYDTVLERGLCSAGTHWRKAAIIDEKGDRALGPIIATLETSKPKSDGTFDEGTFSVIFVQGQLVKLLLEEVRQTGLVQVLFKTPVSNIEEDSSGITVNVEAAEGPRILKSQYVVGCDGGKSTVRKLLGIKFSGHAWPERLLATDVERIIPKVEPPMSYFTVDRVNWGIITPLESITAGKPGLWRYAMPVPDDSLTDEEALDLKYVNELLLKYVDGPKSPAPVIVRKRLYRMQQLLATTMHRGRVALAGDAAHLNNPVGGLGLCTGLLDVDILSQALDLILNHDFHDPQGLLEEYSSARRFVFQNFVDPISAANKLRLQHSDPDAVGREDWYLRALVRREPEELAIIHRPFFQAWRTKIQQLTKYHAPRVVEVPCR